MAVVVNAYYGIQVAIADTNPHNLLALLQAVDSSLNGVLQGCQTLKIQASVLNGSNAVYIGDSHISTSRFGYELLTHDQVPYSLIAYNCPLSAIWVLASAATVYLNVEITF